jgi:hypothetical protein
MNITIKEIKEDGSEFLTYFINDKGENISASIMTKDEKDDMLGFLKTYEKPFKLKKMKYNEYINQ